MSKIDLSVLPDNFLVQPKHGGTQVHYVKFGSVRAQWANGEITVRPALNIWHFNDGSMVLPDCTTRLPDGLVVECQALCMYEGAIEDTEDHGFLITKDYHFYRWCSKYEYWERMFDEQHVIAVKILGLQEGYEHPGMEVVEV